MSPRLSPRRYIAFLRAINVGGRVVKMTELKRIFERLGFGEVATFIASGNVIFVSSATDGAKLEKQIEAGLQKALGYPVATLLRTTAEVTAVAEYEAFPTKALAGASLYVGFLRAEPVADAVKKVLSFRTDTDDLRIHGREVYWLLRAGFAASSVSGAAIEKTVMMSATFRNINTVRKLAAKYSLPAR